MLVKAFLFCFACLMLCSNILRQYNLVLCNGSKLYLIYNFQLNPYPLGKKNVFSRYLQSWPNATDQLGGSSWWRSGRLLPWVPWHVGRFTIFKSKRKQYPASKLWVLLSHYRWYKSWLFLHYKNFDFIWIGGKERKRWETKSNSCVVCVCVTPQVLVIRTKLSGGPENNSCLLLPL